MKERKGLLSQPERKRAEKPILVTKEGVTALQQAIVCARGELAQKTLEMGRVAKDGDGDLHENYQFRDLNLEIQGPIPRRILDLEAQLLRVQIGEGVGNFNRQFVAKIETPGDNPEVQTIRIVGPIEVNHIGHTGPNGERYISYESPMGRALLHAKLEKEATYEFDAPIGSSKITIVEVKEQAPFYISI